MSEELKPAAWLHEIPGSGVWRLYRSRYVSPQAVAEGWAETPLYAHPVSSPPQNDAGGEGLNPAACPFCGASMSHCIDKDGEFWMHPGTVTDGDCFMSGQGIFPRQVAAWNRRAHPSPDKSDNDAVFRSGCGASTSQGADGRHAPNVADPLSELQALGQEFEAGWRPIETAPKGGKNVLLLIGETIPDLSDVRVGCYLTMQDARDVGYPDAGWLVWNDCHDYFVTDRATHWMPLPSSPSGEGSDHG